jgi:hypothetical protein
MISTDNVKIMIVFFLLLLLPVFLTISCKQDPIKEYGNEVIDAYDRAGGTVDIANLRGLQNAVQMYRTQNGRYPDSLEDVAGFMNSQVNLNKYQYNPDTGKVQLKYN